MQGPYTNQGFSNLQQPPNNNRVTNGDKDPMMVAGMVDVKRMRNLPAGEGCVVLGLDGPEDKQYVTRYGIDHKQQRNRLCCEVMEDEWIPCCSEESRGSPGRILWSVVSSEVVLFTLHMGTIFLGVFKVSHPHVSEDEDLETIHSIIEMIVTCLLLILRTAAGWVEYQELKESIYRHEHIVDKRYAKGRHIKLWLVLYTASSSILFALVTITFGVFYAHDHLSWTILVNQFTLVAILSTSGLFSARLRITVRKISEDQHKAIIAESLLLMKEGYAANTAEEKEKYLSRASAFSEALATHETFKRPKHVDVKLCYRQSVGSIDKLQFMT